MRVISSYGAVCNAARHSNRRENPTHDPDAKGAEAVQNLFERNRGRTHLIHLFALSGHLAPRVRASAIGHARDE